MKKKRYRNYTAKKYKLPKRILFFVICALIIFIFAIIFGNHLKNKMENADIDREPIETYDDVETSLPSGIESGDAEHPEAAANVKAGYLSIPADADEQAIHSAVDKLKTNGFNAVSFICISGEKLTYASKAAEDFSRLPASQSVVSLEDLGTAVSYAKQKGLRTSAVFEKGTEEALDISLCGELASLGFDEIILSGFESLLSEDGGEITPCIEYLKKIRSNTEGCAISLLLSPAAYTYARNSYQIEMLFTYAEFLSIDMTQVDKAATEELCDKISGSFSTYMLRPVMNGNATDISSLLIENGITSVQYISEIPAPEPDTSVTDTTPEN